MLAFQGGPVGFAGAGLIHQGQPHFCLALQYLVCLDIPRVSRRVRSLIKAVRAICESFRMRVILETELSGSSPSATPIPANPRASSASVLAPGEDGDQSNSETVLQGPEHYDQPRPLHAINGVAGNGS